MKILVTCVAICLCLFCTSILSSCNDDESPCQDSTNPDCENYNPCWNQKQVSADFEMSQIKPIVPSWMDEFQSDVAFARGRVGFKAIETSQKATYTWKLGTETIEGRSFVRDFSNTGQTGENDIPVTLIIQKEPNLKCFPDDDGKDTVTRYIHFVENACEYLTNGDFKVLFEGETDSVIVGIRNWYQSTSGPSNPIEDSCGSNSQVLIGFDHDVTPNDTSWDGSRGIQYNSKILFGGGIGGGIIGSAQDGYLKVNERTLSVEASYKILRGGEVDYSKQYHFKGRKIK